MKRSLSRLLDIAGPILSLLMVIGLFSLKAELRDSFLTVRNFKFIGTQTVIVAVAALGMTMIIVSAGIDLSVGSTIALTGVVAAVAMRSGHSPSVAILLAMLAGGVIGLINGSLISLLKITPFIITLGMLGIARGAAKWLASEQTVSYPASWINELMAPLPKAHWMIVAPGLWLAVLLAVFMAVVMRNTVFGRHIFAIGSNESTAILCGINVSLVKPLIYASAGLLFGLAGLLQLARLREGDPTSAVGLELDVIAAVVIGGASLSGGTGSIFGSMVGALIMAVLRNGSQQMGWPTYMQEIIIGAVIIAAVALDRFRHGAIR